MPQRKPPPEAIVAKLRQVDVLVSQGRSVAEAMRRIGVTPFTWYRWRKAFGGLKTDLATRLKELKREASNATGSSELANGLLPVSWTAG